MPPTYSEHAARAAIAASKSYAESLRRLGMCPSGGAHTVLRKWAQTSGISTEHFDPYAFLRAKNRKIGRKYGVSDNAIRKWLRCYELEEGHEAA